MTPSPNCGHGGRTFTFVALAAVWMCGLCMASIGPLYRRCVRCAALPTPSDPLVSTARGTLCRSCRRDYALERRFPT